MLDFEGLDALEWVDMVMMGGELGWGLALIECDGMVMKLEMIVVTNREVSHISW